MSSDYSDEILVQNREILIKEYLQKKFNEEFDVKYEKLKGGNSNLVYKCELKNIKSNEKFLIVLRIYGSQLTGSGNKFLNKKKEIMILNELKKFIKIPEILYYFENGRIEQFLELQSLTKENFFDLEVAKKISFTLAKIHSINMEKIIEIDKHQLKNTIQSLYKKFLSRKTYLKNCEMSNISLKQNLEKILNYDFDELINWFFKIEERIKSRMVFSHNDTNTSNFLWLGKNNEKKNIILIDFEYSAYNYRFYDLSYYLVEITCLKANSNKNIFENFPSELYIKSFSENYLNFWSKFTGNSLIDKDIDNSENLIYEIKFGCIAVNLIRLFWCLNHEKISTLGINIWETACSRFNFLEEQYKTFSKNY